jgi:hypothetical protein
MQKKKQVKGTSVKRRERHVSRNEYKIPRHTESVILQ